MRVLGGIRLGEGSSIDNITLPVGDTFPEDENLGELFYLKGHPTKAPGIYICENLSADDENLEWRLILNIDSADLKTGLLEIGATRALYIYSEVEIPIRWDFYSTVDAEFFTHSTEGPESSKVYVEKDGFYQISYTLNSSQEKNSDQRLRCFVRINGADTVGRSVTNTWSQGPDYPSTNSNVFVARLRAGDFIEVLAKPASIKGNFSRVYTIDESCGLALTRIGGLE